jgi:hypothetical protein
MPIFVILFLLISLSGLQADDDRTPIQKKYAARTQKAFEDAKARYLADTNNVKLAIAFASAAFDSGDAAADDSKREDYAHDGMAVANHLLDQDAKSAAGHYYLAMNEGQWAKADAPSLTSYRLVKEMEKEFKLANTYDETFDYAGPARCLGELYRDAPGWPLSIGSKKRAREYLEKASKIAPNYPENRLNLAESYLKWKDLDAARKELSGLDAIWSKAKTQLSDPYWDQPWEEWAARRAALHQKLDQSGDSSN